MTVWKIKDWLEVLPALRNTFVVCVVGWWRWKDGPCIVCCCQMSPSCCNFHWWDRLAFVTKNRWRAWFLKENQNWISCATGKWCSLSDGNWAECNKHGSAMLSVVCKHKTIVVNNCAEVFVFVNYQSDQQTSKQAKTCISSSTSLARRLPGWCTFVVTSTRTFFFSRLSSC